MSALPDSLPACLHDEALIGRLCERAGVSRWGVGAGRFAQALAGAVSSRFAAAATAGGAGGASGGEPDAAAVERFLESLHLEDLALAVGCAEGDERAWELFISTHRADLRRAAGAIAGAGQADDLADTLLGELFGVDARGGARRSLFLYFHGRSRLSTWLRAILAQRHVDRLRASKRTVSLDAMELSEAEQALPSEPPAAPDPDRARLVNALQQGIDTALGALDANERLRLTWYHVDGMTLAEMGRLFREHEATASRKLQRIRTRVRDAVDEFLLTRAGLDRAQIRLGYEYALEEGGLDWRALASPLPSPRPSSSPSPAVSSAVSPAVAASPPAAAPAATTPPPAPAAATVAPSVAGLSAASGPAVSPQGEP
jgi:RNA polymerase sigma-70 factor